MAGTKFDGQILEFDPPDWKGMKELMDRSDEFEVPWSGKNEKGENIMISVNADNITVVTFQDNGWTRENIYHKDYTVEELYKR